MISRDEDLDLFRKIGDILIQFILFTQGESQNYVQNWVAQQIGWDYLSGKQKFDTEDDGTGRDTELDQLEQLATLPKGVTENVIHLTSTGYNIRSPGQLPPLGIGVPSNLWQNEESSFDRLMNQGMKFWQGNPYASKITNDIKVLDSTVLPYIDVTPEQTKVNTAYGLYGFLLPKLNRSHPFYSLMDFHIGDN